MSPTLLLAEVTTTWADVAMAALFLGFLAVLFRGWPWKRGD